MTRRISGFLIFLLVCVLTAIPALAQRAGVLTAAEGGVWAESDGQRRSLAVKSEVRSQDVLTTDARGKATILLDDDTIISLGPAATIRIRDFAFDGEAKPALALELVRGVSRIVSGKVVEQNPEGFSITSPLASIGIRGTITQHHILPNQERHFAEYLSSGHEVFIKGPDGTVVILKQSLTGIELIPGQKTPSPRPMTPQERQWGRDSTLSMPPRVASPHKDAFRFPPRHVFPEEALENAREQELQTYDTPLPQNNPAQEDTP